MNLFHLPQDLLTTSAPSNSGLVVCNYEEPGSTSKASVVFTKNAISLVLEGHKTMHFAKQTLSIDNSEFHLFGSGNCVASMMLPPSTTFRTILIFFDDKVLNDFYQENELSVQKLRIRKKTESFLTFPKDDFVVNFIQSMQVLTRNDTLPSHPMMQLKFKELMRYLLEKYPEKITSFSGGDKNDLSDFDLRNTVQQNITNDITIEELAFMCNMSVSTFKRRFFKVYNAPPNKWLIKKKMELAAQMILYANEKPGAIYHKLGYKNHSSFSKIFRKFYGVPPKLFREENLNQ